MQNKNSRHIKGQLTTLGAVGTHLRNPWVAAWWSAALPGFGHFLLSNHFVGFVLLIWEFIINTHAHINLAILYSFTGQYAMAREVVDSRWLLLYIGVYVYAIWDCYAETVEQNKYYILAEREDVPLSPSKVNEMQFSFARKKRPVFAVLWSLITPGLGHFFARKILEGFTIVSIVVLIVYETRLCPAIQFSFIGDFGAAKATVDYGWLLFLPSLYCYAVYASYISVVEVNKFYDAEQARYLKRNYMDTDFVMPV